MLARLSGKGAYGASLAFGALAAIDILFVFLPKLRPLTHLAELVQLYLERLHPAFGLLGGNSWLIRVGMICVLAWLSSWFALEAFSRATNELSLWRSIALESCGLTRPGFRRFACTTSKWIFTLVAGPALIVLALAKRVLYGSRSVSVAYVSFAPGIVIKYMRHVFVGLGALATGAVLMSRFG